MKTVEVFDKPMCCASGVCGPEVDPVLPKFAADLEWLRGQGHRVERYNLAQQPQAFIEHKAIHQLLSTTGTDCLPVVVVDGEIMSQAIYPSRETLNGWVAGPLTMQAIPIIKPKGGGCGATGCC
ncbi:MAG: arsenite efflux transporter metallochaperone ArsD [Pirellulaceae bacterium]